MEECGEVIKGCAKIQRFGAEDTAPFSDVTNMVKLETEMNQVVAVYFMYLKAKGIQHEEDFDIGIIEAKVTKVRKWMEYSRRNGTLDD